MKCPSCNYPECDHCHARRIPYEVGKPCPCCGAAYRYVDPDTRADSATLRDILQRRGYAFVKQHLDTFGQG